MLDFSIERNYHQVARSENSCGVDLVCVKFVVVVDMHNFHSTLTCIPQHELIVQNVEIF